MTLRWSASALIAIGVFATIALRIWLRMEAEDQTVGEAVWHLFRYYTLWTNALIGLACAALALGKPQSPQGLSNLLLSIIIVAAVYHALLASQNSYTGLDALVDTMLHTIIPLAFAGFWLVFVPKASLVFKDILPWLILPLAYCIYAMARAQFDGEYPYFFLNLDNLGVVRTARNILGLLVAFALVGAVIIITAKALSRFDPSTKHHRT